MFLKFQAQIIFKCLHKHFECLFAVVIIYKIQTHWCTFAAAFINVLCLLRMYVCLYVIFSFIFP